MCVCDISGRKKNTSKGHTPKKVNNGYLYISIKEIYVFFFFYALPYLSDSIDYTMESEKSHRINKIITSDIISSVVNGPW